MGEWGGKGGRACTEPGKARSSTGRGPRPGLCAGAADISPSTRSLGTQLPDPEPAVGGGPVVGDTDCRAAPEPQGTGHSPRSQSPATRPRQAEPGEIAASIPGAASFPELGQPGRALGGLGAPRSLRACVWLVHVAQRPRLRPLPASSPPAAPRAQGPWASSRRRPSIAPSPRPPPPAGTEGPHPGGHRSQVPGLSAQRQRARVPTPAP